MGGQPFWQACHELRPTPCPAATSTPVLLLPNLLFCFLLSAQFAPAFPMCFTHQLPVPPAACMPWVGHPCSKDPSRSFVSFSSKIAWHESQNPEGNATSRKYQPSNLDTHKTTKNLSFIWYTSFNCVKLRSLPLFWRLSCTFQDQGDDYCSFLPSFGTM